MTRVIAGGERSARWIEARTGCVLTPQATMVSAVHQVALSPEHELQRIRGVVAYDNWTENAVQAHMAVESPIVWRHLLEPAFDYPFRQCGKGVLLGIIPSHNSKSVEMTRSLGFRESHRVKDGWAKGDDLIVFEMRREDCRYLKE